MNQSIVPNSLDQMAEEIFAITLLALKERVASKRQDDEPDLSESQFLALDALMRAPGVLTVGEIQRGIGVLPAQMSRIIRSLESSFDKPLIKCELNQQDKRKIDVAVTVEGRKLYASFRGMRLGKTIEILKGLSEADRAEFVRICQLLKPLYRQPEA